MPADTRIYVDHGATTPTDPRVVEAMLPFLTEKFGNASSVHQFGQEARAAVDQARQVIASAIGATPQELVLTSGPTAAHNFAMLIAPSAHDAPSRQIMITGLVNHPWLEPLLLIMSRGL